MSKEPKLTALFEDKERGDYLIVRPDPYEEGNLFIERGAPGMVPSWISLEPAEAEELTDVLNNWRVYLSERDRVEVEDV